MPVATVALLALVLLLAAAAQVVVGLRPLQRLRAELRLVVAVPTDAVPAIAVLVQQHAVENSGRKVLENLTAGCRAGSCSGNRKEMEI